MAKNLKIVPERAGLLGTRKYLLTYLHIHIFYFRTHVQKQKMQRKENSLQSKANIQLKSLSNDVIINEMKCRKIPLEDLPDEIIINEVKRRKISLQKLEHLPEEFISANRSKLEKDIFQPQLKKRMLASFEVRT